MSFILTDNGIEHSPFQPLTKNGREDLIGRATRRREAARVKTEPQPNNENLCADCFRALALSETMRCAICRNISEQRINRQEQAAIRRDKWKFLAIALVAGALIVAALHFGPRQSKPVKIGRAAAAVKV